MTSDKTIRRMIPWGAALILYAVFSLTGTLYVDYDNYNVAIVVNGLLGNNNYCQYQHPLLCLILNPLNFIIEGADTFTLTVHILIIAALARVITVLRDFFTDRITRLLIWSAILYLSWCVNLWNVNYTAQAAFLCFAGLLELTADKSEEKSKLKMAAGLMFFAFGMMIRHEPALLFLPYIILLILSERKFKPYICLIITIILLAGSRTAFYSVEPFRSGLEFDRARQRVADYPLSEWEDLEKTGDLTDRTIYNGARWWMYADTELLNIENLRRAADAGSRKRLLTADYILNFVKAFGIHCLRDPARVLLPLALIITMTAGLCLNKRGWDRLITASSLPGTLLIIVYFMLKGRAPLRVWQSVMLADLAYLMTIVIKCKPRGVRGDGVVTRAPGRYIISALSAAALTIAAVYGICSDGSLHKPVTAFTARTEVGADSFRDIYDQGIKYLVCGYNLKIAYEEVKISYLYGWHGLEGTYADKGKLPPKEFFRRFISSGDFFYGQEYYRSLLEEVGVINPVRALCEQDDVMLLDMSEDTMFREFFFPFLYDHYGEMTVKKVGDINGYPVYNFYR